MPPRFGSDDWLDNTEPAARAKSSKKPILNRAQLLPDASANGTVLELFPNQSCVRLDVGKPLLCNYRMSTLAFGVGSRRERSPVCVGDRVRVEGDVIVGRCERRNRLVRPAPNARDPVLHVLAANVDVLVVVSSAREPDFSPGIVDRFLVAAQSQKIPQILCVNKADLLGAQEARPWSHYADAGVTLLEASASDGSGTERLRELVKGKVAVFCGNSGVGKTSLLRRLLNDANYGRVGAISESSGKGRHTTSGAVLLAGPEGSSLIDTPGVMNFGLVDVTQEDLLALFPDLQAAANGCGPECAHADESSCRLRLLPRYVAYRALLATLPSAAE